MAISARAVSGDNDLAAKLARFLEREFVAANVRIGELTRQSTGMSRENWMFGAEWRDDQIHRQRLILRRDPLGGMLETDRRCEYEVLRALHSAGLPVPAVYGADFTGAWLERPSLIMEVVPGECEYYALTGPRSPETRLRLAHDFLDLLVSIQEVNWRSLALDEVLEHPGENASLHELDRWNRELLRVQLEPMPEMQLIHAWLRANARQGRKTVLVHGDFKPGNALILNDQISAMLDWETAHLGDPLEDLGWITNPARSSEHQIEGLWERTQIADAFRRRTGYAFDDQELHWWNVFSCWKLAIIILTGVNSASEGRFDRINHNPTWLYHRMFKMTEAGQ